MMNRPRIIGEDALATEAVGPPAVAPATAPATADRPWPPEIDGRAGPEPTRFGDWEKNGRCIDF